MASLNRVMLIGNLTRDPSLRYTTHGLAVCDLGMAVHRRWRSRDGELREDTTFVAVNVLGEEGERCGRRLEKGARVLVEGRLRRDQWEGKQGEKRSKLRVMGERVQFLG